MNILPISPLVGADGNLVSLSGLRGTLSATPISLDPGSGVGGLSMVTQQLSVSVAAKLGVGSIFASSVQANELGFWLDAMAFADSSSQPTPGNIISQTRWGYGLRILCRVQQIDTSVNLNFAMLGAAVDLKLATASYEVQTIGLGPAALGVVLSGLSQFGALNSLTFHDLNTTVIKKLADLLANPPTPLALRPISVQLAIPVEAGVVSKAHSEVFAMRRIRDNMPLKIALTRAAGHYDNTVIGAVYQKLTPGTPDTSQPGNAAKAYAKQWMG